MLLHLPDVPARSAARLGWLPPLLGLTGVLMCGLPILWRALLALACLLRLAAVACAWRGAGGPARAGGHGGRLMFLHASASGTLSCRTARGACVAAGGAAHRVDAGGVQLALGAAVLAVNAQQGRAGAARALARHLLMPLDPRWQPCLPRQRWWRTARRPPARFGYNRALRVRRSPPCLPS